jgi:hypothetical protein
MQSELRTSSPQPLSATDQLHLGHASAPCGCHWCWSVRASRTWGRAAVASRLCAHSIAH